MSKRILLVDDDPDIRQVLQDRLDAYGYDVETAGDGVEALIALRLNTYDGMLLDIAMPNIDGLEVLYQLRRCDQAMPVIVMTALKDRERIIQEAKGRCQAILFKPFHAVDLRQILERWFTAASERPQV